MTPDAHRRAFAVFDRLRTVPSDEWEAALLGETDLSEEVKEAARSLLRNDSPTGEFRGVPVLSTTAGLWEGIEPALIPRRLGRYRIARLLGSGGFGSVYLAEQTNPHRSVAIKIVRPGLSPEHEHRLVFEAEALARLNHPAIAGVYELDHAPELGGRPFLVMEYVLGVPIDRHVREHALSTDAVLSLLAVVCDGVEHAHRRGVLHRDLAPKNILITPEGLPKIVDFGLASEAAARSGQGERITLPGSVIGTLRYLSPEQLGGRPDAIDTRSDVFSLGVMACELVAGRHPFVGEPGTLSEAVDLMMRAPAVRPSATLRGHPYGRDLDAVLLKAIDRDPARRYQSAEAFRHDLRALADRRPVAAGAAGAAYRAIRFCSRHRLAIAGMLAASLVIAGAALSSVLSLRGELRARESAINAIDVVLARLLSPLAPRVGTLQERERLLDAIGPDVLAMSAQARSDPRIAAILANYLLATADVHREQGRSGPALEAYGSAVAAYGRLWRVTGHDPRVGHAYSIAIVKLGDAEMAAGRRQAGRALYERALTLDESLVAGRPEDLPLLSNLFWSYCRLSGLPDQPGPQIQRWADAADEVADRMAAIDPEAWRTREARVHVILRRSSVLSAAQDQAGALDATLEAVDAAEELLAMEPTNATGLATLVHALRYSINAATLAGQVQLATDLAGRAEETERVMLGGQEDLRTPSAHLSPLDAARASRAFAVGNDQAALFYAHRRIGMVDRMLAAGPVDPDVVLTLGQTLQIRGVLHGRLGDLDGVRRDVARLEALASQIRTLFPRHPGGEAAAMECETSAAQLARDWLDQ